jgi:glycyl-tRNA synthetase beta subunit
VAIERLEAWMARADWAPRLQAFARCVRIVRSEKGLYSVDPQKLQEGAEVALHQALISARESQRQSGSVDDFMQAFDPLIEPITQFFLEVMVMVDEAEVRRNRLGLLQQITGLAAGVADLSQLEGF